MSISSNPPDPQARDRQAGARPAGQMTQGGDGRDTTDSRAGAGSLRIPRSRGAVSGLALIILGIWGAIIPFIGPYFHYAYINYSGFDFPTSGRLWLNILPGLLAIVGGAELLRSAHQPTAALGAWLAAVAGAWFVVGQSVSTLWNHGQSQAGPPLGGTVLRAVEQLGYYYALGAVILFLAATALGRLAVRSVRDVRAGEQRAAERPGQHA